MPVNDYSPKMVNLIAFVETAIAENKIEGKWKVVHEFSRKLLLVGSDSYEWFESAHNEMSFRNVKNSEVFKVKLEQVPFGKIHNNKCS